MSKAFTKDDGPDAPVLVPRRAPLPSGTPNYVTARGLQALRDELARLDAEAPRPGGGADAGNRPELQAFAARRADLEQRIATAVVVPPPAARDEIRFGARARVRGGGAGGGVRVLQIVGVDEADPAAGLIAFISPVARALLGRRAGDLVTVRAPGGDEELEVLAVDYDAE